MSANYVAATSLTLTFDRAIDISGLYPSGVSVWDGSVSYGGTVGELVAADTVRLDLTINGDASSDVPTLYTGPANGIVAAGSGEPWEGVSGLVLPFP